MNTKRAWGSLLSAVRWLRGKLEHFVGVVTDHRVSIGVLISIVCLVLALRQVAWREVLRSLQRADYSLIALAMVLQVGAVFATAMRWKAFFYPYSNLRAGKFVSVAFIGEFANTFLPARLGSVVRIALIGEVEEVSKAFALGTIVVEKVFDGLILLVMFGLLIPFISFPGWLWRAGVFTLVVIAIVLLASALAKACSRRGGIIPDFWQWTRLPLVGRVDFMEHLRMVMDSFQALRSMKVSRGPLAWSLLILVLGILVNVATLAALGIQVPYIGPVLLWTVLQIGGKVPSLPSNVGVFEYLCLFSLSLFSVDKSLAVSFGFLLHLIVLLPPILLGTFFLWRENHSLWSLQRTAQYLRPR